MIILGIYLIIGVVIAFIVAKYWKPDVTDPQYTALESPQVQRMFLAAVALVWPVILFGLRVTITKEDAE